MAHPLRIGTYLVEHVESFWVEVQEAIYQQAQLLGVDLVDLNLDTFRFPSDAGSPALAEGFLAQKIDVLIGGSDDDARRNLPFGISCVLLSETDLQHALLISPRGLYDVAHTLGSYIGEQLGGRGKVLVIGGSMAASGEDGRSRIAGIRDTLSAYPCIDLGYIPSPWTYAESYATLYAAMQRLDERVAALIGLSDTVALAGSEAGRALGLIDDQTFIAGINGDSLALAAIANGKMTATMETPAAAFGRRAMNLAHQAALKQAVPAYFGYNARLVTAQNVAEIAAQKLYSLAGLPRRLAGVHRHREQVRLAQLETSWGITRRISSILNRHQLVSEIINLIRAHYDYDRVQLFLWREREQELVLDQVDQPALEELRIPIEAAGVLGQAIRADMPIFIPAASHSQSFAPDPSGSEIKSGMVVPVHLGSSIVGLLDLHDCRSTSPTRQEVLGLQLLADQLGVAMHNAQLYEDALDARASAEEANRLKSRFLAMVSHELRTPLNLIIGLSEMQLRGQHHDLQPGAFQDLERIHASARHLGMLIGDVLDLASTEAGQLRLLREPLDLCATLEVVLTTGEQMAAERRLSWQAQLPAQGSLVLADRTRLRQVVLNLISNAVKFTAHGSVTLEVIVEPGQVTVAVTDTGIGVPLTEQALIFEEFHRSERSVARGYGGLGLGLAICKQLIELHGGEIGVRSAGEDQGATFFFRLPTIEPVADVAASEQPIAILIGHEPGRESTESYLRDHGFSIRVIRVDLEADWLPRLLANPPRIILLDKQLAEQQGWQIIDILQRYATTADIPVTVCAFEAGRQSSALLELRYQRKPLDAPKLARLLTGLDGKDTDPAAARTVLIVDDDLWTLDLHTRIVQEHFSAYAVLQARNGREALAIMRQTRPDLVLLDLMMPELDGFGVLEAMRESAVIRDVPVVVLTAQTLSEADLQRLNRGVTTILSKGVFRTREILAHIEAALDRRQQPGTTQQLVRKAVAYIQEHYGEPITREQIAAHVGVVEDYLSQCFRRELAVAVMNYLTRYRIHQARTLLEAGHLNVTEVAMEVGFEDGAYFSRVFLREVGISPAAYRKGKRCGD